MKLTVKKFDDLGDWYEIERAEHDGREWFETVSPNCQAFRRSARIGDASVEGTAAHMLGLADAIERREFKEFKRCAVDANTDRNVWFWSPRNTQNRGEPCTLAEADELAAEIRRVCVLPTPARPHLGTARLTKGATNMSQERPWEVNDVVQIDPAHDPRFGGCFMVITEPKSWGAQGYVSIPGETGLAYYRCPTSAMVLIGKAEWAKGGDDDTERD